MDLSTFMMFLNLSMATNNQQANDPAPAPSCIPCTQQQIIDEKNINDRLMADVDHCTRENLKRGRSTGCSVMFLHRCCPGPIPDRECKSYEIDLMDGNGSMAYPHDCSPKSLHKIIMDFVTAHPDTNLAKMYKDNPWYAPKKRKGHH